MSGSEDSEDSIDWQVDPETLQAEENAFVDGSPIVTAEPASEPYMFYSTPQANNARDAGIADDPTAEPFVDLSFYDDNDVNPFLPPVFGDESILITNYTRYVVIADKSDGSVIAEYDLSQELGYEPYITGGAYIDGVLIGKQTYSEGHTVGFDDSTGEILWDLRNPDGWPDYWALTMPAVDEESGTIITAGADSSSCWFWEVAPDGTVVQSNKFSISDEFLSYQAPTMYDPGRGLVCVPLDESELLVTVDRSDFSVVHKRSPAPHGEEALTMDPDTGDVFGSDNPGRYDPCRSRRYDPEADEIVWEYNWDEPGDNRSPEYNGFITDDGLFLVSATYEDDDGNFDWMVLGLSVSDGTKEFEYKTGIYSSDSYNTYRNAYDSATNTWVGPVIPSGKVSAWDPIAQEARWELQASNTTDDQLNSAVYKGAVYFPGYDDSGASKMFKAE